jgi:hypothetical protein
MTATFYPVELLGGQHPLGLLKAQLCREGFIFLPCNN